MSPKTRGEGDVDSDYVVPDSTESTTEHAKHDQSVQVSEELYGVAKPRRRILRGKIIRDP